MAYLYGLYVACLGLLLAYGLVLYSNRVISVAYTNMRNIPRFLTSSADPTQVAATARGIFKAIVAVLVIAFGFTEAELMPIVDLLVDIVTYTMLLYGTGQALFGLARKLYLRRWSA